MHHEITSPQRCAEAHGRTRQQNPPLHASALSFAPNQSAATHTHTHKAHTSVASFFAQSSLFIRSALQDSVNAKADAT